MKRQRDFDPYPPSSTASNAYTPYPPSTSARQPLPMPSFGGGSGRRGSNRQPASNASKRVKVGGGQSAAPLVSPPLHDAAYVTSCYNALGGRGEPNKKHLENPKGVLANYITALGEQAKYKGGRARVGTWDGFRATIIADPNPPAVQTFGAPSLPPMPQPVVGTGDAGSLKDAEKLAALHACLQLSARGLFTESNLPTRMRGMKTPLHVASQGGGGGGGGSGGGQNGQFAVYASTGATGAATPGNDGKTVSLGGGKRIGIEEARAFMDYYCQRFNFGRPDLQFSAVGSSFGRGKSAAGSWCATLLVNGRRIGVGEARNKKDAQNRAYLDTSQYLESCDPDLWNQWCDKKALSGNKAGGATAHVVFDVDPRTDEELRETVYESRDSGLYKRAKAMVERDRLKALAERERQRLRGANGDEGQTNGVRGGAAGAARRAADRAPFIERKSEELLKRLENYQIDPRVERMRTQRASLPVGSHASSVLAKIATSSVVVVLAATGSGKTTQVPQLILDDWIMRGEGAKCNIVCTQPRRIAAISVAERVAKERGENIGDSVGYQVRFESKPPKPDGSILFCTTGLFLRRLQSDLANNGSGGFLDGVTHVAVDEVHERDVDTDLLLFVLRRLLHERRKAGKAEIRVILMSATIDPILFTTYFADPDTGRHAPVVEVPGRSFPVDKHFLDDTVRELQALRLPPAQGGWIWNEKSVQMYTNRELVPTIEMDHRTGRPIGEIDDLDMPYPLISLIIAWVLSKSDEGHVLVFLPGWDEIQAVRNILIDRNRYPLFDINFGDRQYEIHVLHSTIPLAEQQAVFEPPAEGIRRIVLSTNIAETSVTIPDVVYVVDSAKCKEKRYDPERRLSQLVSAWTGTSNVLQRAGRAGRHRPGEYYGIVSKARFASMDIHQTVEMLRTDLANTCMHITGLELPGLSVEDVLSSTIQPPERVRIHAAMSSLKMVGAIDRDEALTSLGRVLLQLPVDAAIGKLCLLGSFFRCLDQTLTLAAILTNRDPFMSPPLLKPEADRIKNSWTPVDFRSDPLAVLTAFNVWWGMQSRNEFVAANNFARENFLSKPTLIMIQKIKEHILQSLDKVGVLQISAGGTAVASTTNFRRGGSSVIPDSLNVNGDSLPLLSALIAAAVAPNFAIRTSEKSLRTSQDKTCAIHPSSVNSKKNVEAAPDTPVTLQKQLYAFGEKSKTGGVGGKGDGQMFLRSCTRLDPIGYMLFGASSLKVTDQGLECDQWLPIVGNVSALDDVERLKDVLDHSLLRVFEGLGNTSSKGPGRQSNQPRRVQDRHDEEGEGEADQEVVNMDDPTLSPGEVVDLDRLTSGVVKVLNMFSDSQRSQSRSETPSYGHNASHGHNSHQGSGSYGGGPSHGGHGGSYGNNANAPGPLRPFASSVPATRAASPRDNSRPSTAGGMNAYGGGGGGGGGDWRSRN